MQMAYLTTALPDLSAWAHFLTRTSVPVLGETVTTLEALRLTKDQVSARQIAAMVIRDPLMTLSVFVWCANRRRGRLSSLGNGEIETVEAAIVMMGVHPFFDHFQSFESCETRLSPFPGANEGLSAVVDRAIRASALAADWAVLRKDFDAQVIQEAALLHDVVEMIVWCVAPELCLQMVQHQKSHPGTRSVALQKVTLGVTLNALEQEMFRRWQLPSLLIKLTDDQLAAQPAIRNVALAVNLARHSANGWDNAALEDDYRDIAGLLKMPVDWVRANVRELADV